MVLSFFGPNNGISLEEHDLFKLLAFSGQANIMSCNVLVLHAVLVAKYSIAIILSPDGICGTKLNIQELGLHHVSINSICMYFSSISELQIFIY